MQGVELAARELEGCAADAAPLDRITSPTSFAGHLLHGPSPSFTHIPLDTAVAHDTGDVLADPLFEYRPPRQQAEPVVDHGVAPAGEWSRRFLRQSGQLPSAASAFAFIASRSMGWFHRAPRPLMWHDITVES
jgi:hypothetical protein